MEVLLIILATIHFFVMIFLISGQTVMIFEGRNEEVLPLIPFLVYVLIPYSLLLYLIYCLFSQTVKLGGIWKKKE